MEATRALNNISPLFEQNTSTDEARLPSGTLDLWFSLKLERNLSSASNQTDELQTPTYQLVPHATSTGSIIRGHAEQIPASPAIGPQFGSFIGPRSWPSGGLGHKFKHLAAPPGNSSTDTVGPPFGTLDFWFSLELR